ncbi:MAG TPA: FAD-binding oxidoreductase [Gaiellaceae bacterium]|nr:FAD-binding oxidoreductase [Gaiellaceae bacterium]
MTEIQSAAGSAAAGIGALRARIQGDVVLPGEPAWDEARLAWNLAADQRPAAVVYAESAADVSATVQAAVASGLRVAPQGTGHGAMALGELADTILLKTSRLRGVSIDPEARRGRAEAGVLWIEVVEEAVKHGLTALHGSSPDVGVVGYSLGGGIGWLARRYGLAVNGVTAVELVMADGRLVRADAETESDLFWAVRGGGGSFGVVTAIELELYPIEEVYAGVLFFPAERGPEVLHAWRTWTETVPDEVTSVGRYMSFPPFPQVPEPLRGRSFVLVEAVFLGDEAEGAELIRPLRELGPAMDTFATVPAIALTRLHMDPEDPVPGVGDGFMLRSLPPEAVDALVEVAGAESGSPLLSVEVRHLGGALAQPQPGNGALASLDARFAVFAVGIGAPEIAAAVEAQLAKVQEALAPWRAEQAYFNFAEADTDAAGFYAPTVYRRLRAIRAEVDPDGVCVANHPIG